MIGCAVKLTHQDLYCLRLHSCLRQCRAHTTEACWQLQQTDGAVDALQNVASAVSASPMSPVVCNDNGRYTLSRTHSRISLLNEMNLKRMRVIDDKTKDQQDTLLNRDSNDRSTPLDSTSDGTCRMMKARGKGKGAKRAIVPKLSCDAGTQPEHCWSGSGSEQEGSLPDAIATTAPDSHVTTDPY